MGSALAKAFAATDLDVTVWNRTSDKCDAMVSEGAAVADSMSEAVDRSEVIVVCVRGYDVATDLFRQADVAALLAGKIVVQLGNGVPAEVSDAAHWFSEHDAAYVDGSIMTFPDDVGSADCQVLVSGDPAAFERCRPVFNAIGADVVGNFTAQMPGMFGEYVDMIGSGIYDSTTLRLASGAENLSSIADFGRGRGVDVGLVDAALRVFDEAASAGHGVNLASIFETLRP